MPRSRSGAAATACDDKPMSPWRCWTCSGPLPPTGRWYRVELTGEDQGGNGTLHCFVFEDGRITHLPDLADLVEVLDIAQDRRAEFSGYIFYFLLRFVDLAKGCLFVALDRPEHAQRIIFGRTVTSTTFPVLIGG